MSKALFNRFSPLSLMIGANLLLALTYVAMIAIVMSYAALHVEFAEQVKNDEATVAALESSYLASIGRITATDYTLGGYQKPLARTYVPGSQTTAVTIR